LRIICRVPVRINLANGGDTDYYVNEIGWGCVVNATLSSHFYEFEINDSNEGKIDIVDYFNPSSLNRTYYLEQDISELDLLKATMKELNLELKHSFVLRTNVPMQSGLGGSSTLNVAMIAAMLRYKGEKLSAHKVASMAYDIERNKLNVPGGYQDQFAAAYGGGFNYMEFKDKEVTVKNLNLPEETIQKLESRLFLYYLSKREVSGSQVHKSQKNAFEANKEEMKRLLIEKRTNVLRIKAALLDGKLDDFGKMLMKEGEIKAKMTGDAGYGFAKEIIDFALKSGVTGCKVLGAGGGGCVLFYVPEKNIYSFKTAMECTGAVELPFRFQRSHEPGIMLKGDFR